MKGLISFFALSVALAACDNSYEQATQEQNTLQKSVSEVNTEKFQFGKLYSMNNIPEDTYSHIPKDTVDMHIFMQRKERGGCDSIAFYPGPYKVRTTKAQSADVGFSGMLISDYSENLSLTAFSLELRAYYQSQGPNNAVVDFYSYDSTSPLEIDEVTFSRKSVYYSDCVSSFKPHTSMSCEPGYVCEFELRGRVVRIVSSAIYQSKRPLLEFSSAGAITSLGEDFNFVKTTVRKL